jgi:hypothetical protein
MNGIFRYINDISKYKNAYQWFPNVIQSIQKIFQTMLMNLKDIII